MNRSQPRLILLLIIAFLGVVIYANTLNSPFILDDNPNIAENPVIRDLSNFVHPSQAKQFMDSTEYPMLVKRYVSVLSFALNYHFNGLDTTGYHMVNITIHILNAFLLYALVILTFRTPFIQSSRLTPHASSIAFLAGALFVTHPVQTQAVTFIVQRMTSLATLFYLASLVCYIQARLTQKKRKQTVYYVLSLVSAVLGMKSKEIVFTLPLAVVLYEWFFFEGSIRKRIALWIPLGLTLLVIPLTLSALGGTGALSNETMKIQDVSRAHYLMTEARVAVTYLRLLIFPLGQTLNYDYPLYHSTNELPVLSSMILHIFLIVIAVAFYRQSRKREPSLRLITLGICWFYLTLSVESTLIPLFVVFEHRLYLPSVGVFTSASAGVFMLLEKISRRSSRQAFIILVITVPMILGILSITRNAFWHDEESLWEDAVRKAPGHILNRIGLGNVYQDEGRIEEAIAQFQAATISKPAAYGPERLRKPLADVYFNLGNAYKHKGEIEEAAAQWKQALQILPSHTGALNQLGNHSVLQGNYPEAVEYFNNALKYGPRNFEALFNLAIAYEKLGRTDKAARSYQQFIAVAPADYEEAVLSARKKLHSWGVPVK